MLLLNREVIVENGGKVSIKKNGREYKQIGQGLGGHATSQLPVPEPSLNSPFASFHL